MSNFYEYQKAKNRKVIKNTKSDKFNLIENELEIDVFIESSKAGTEEELKKLICYLESSIDEQQHPLHIYVSFLLILLASFVSSILSLIFDNPLQDKDVAILLSFVLIIWLLAMLIFYFFALEKSKINMIKRYIAGRLKIELEKKIEEQK